MQLPKYVTLKNEDLLTAVRLGCGPMQALLWDAPVGKRACFRNVMLPETHPELGNHLNPGAVPHITGRWLDGLLNAEALGVQVSEAAIASLEEAAYETLTDGVPGLPCEYDEAFRVTRLIDGHTFRESMHSLAALAQYRASKRAVELGLLQIRAFTRYFDFETGQFNARLLEEEYPGARIHGLSDRFYFAECFGRYIGPLVKFYRATGEGEALELAQKLKDTCFRLVLHEDGHFDPEVFGYHLHSTTSMLSSLALLGEATGDSGILDRVKTFLEHGATTFTTEFGWCSENFRRHDLVGEINNTTDLVETYLVLGRHGDADYFSRAERAIRGHMLPSQLLDNDFLLPLQDESRQRRALAAESYGAFGFPCPYGHEYEPGAEVSYNYDIVGGGVSGLCAAYRSCVTRGDGYWSVNLLFNREHQAVRVQSPYETGGTLVLTPHEAGSFRVRIPQNAAVKAVSAEHSHVSGGWLYLWNCPAETDVRVSLDFAEQTVCYTHRENSYRLRWYGEKVTAASSEGKRLCFFPEL